MSRPALSRQWLLLIVAVLLVSPSLQSIYNFHLPYCSEIQSDIQVVKNPLRIYLLIFRWLFCLTGSRDEAVKTSNEYLTAAQAKAKADKLFEIEKTAKSCASATSTQSPDNVMLQLSNAAGVIQLPTRSMSRITTDRLNVDVRSVHRIERLSCDHRCFAQFNTDEYMHGAFSCLQSGLLAPT